MSNFVIEIKSGPRWHDSHTRLSGIPGAVHPGEVRCCHSGSLPLTRILGRRDPGHGPTFHSSRITVLTGKFDDPVRAAPVHFPERVVARRPYMYPHLAWVCDVAFVARTFASLIMRCLVHRFPTAQSRRGQTPLRACNTEVHPLFRPLTDSSAILQPPEAQQPAIIKTEHIPIATFFKRNRLLNTSSDSQISAA